MNPYEEIKHEGYSIRVSPYTDSPNPWEEWGTEPPILIRDSETVRLGHLTTYGGVDTVADILPLIPEEKGWNDSIINDIVGIFREVNSYVDRQWLSENYGQADSEEELSNGDWRHVLLLACEDHDYFFTEEEHMDAIESMCRVAGIKTHRTQVTGSSQRDWAHVLAIATPNWIDETGAPASSHEAQLSYAAELYGHWAYGEVYGVAGILDPDGLNIGESSWGYYGWDHNKSGLMCFVKHAIRNHQQKQTVEKIEADAMACRDIITLADPNWENRI